MQYSTLFLSALAATGALAVPTPQFAGDSSITVVLENQAIEVGSQTQFLDGMRQAKPPVGSSGPFATVELRLGPNVKKAGLRCQVLDNNNVPITVVRGANVDITFADGDKGLWTFQNGATEVSQIICDPAFVQGAKPPATGNGDTSIRVTLTDGNLATQTAFQKAGLQVETQNPVGSRGPFNSVSLSVGADVQKQGLRCQILDNMGKAIKVQRGQNIDTTFADGGAGPWKFLNPATSEVSKIICDPAFVKAVAA
ncbi:hypothetical protein BCR34DRAFT_565731 [Clohesyomyces aquaticus]|uniref:Uncharacterized protein n=1 Tax=Clohesyomyces aquaticus TaxID=1231657 RepID=A0A1Y1ZLI4_9PLEO|nr:hypothetical protein BCR34DRAFT_565731 [Clohesyomyces aquaticus]